MHLMERLEFDLLFRWFVGLGIDDAVWDHSTFSKSRDRLLEGEAAVAVGATASEAGVAYTPAPNGAFLNGITRQRVINLLRSDGVTVIETTLHYSDFENADGIFSSDNFAKVAPVIRIDRRNYSMALTIPRRGNSIGNLLRHSYARSF
jgi:branched-subunit amino acid aminotransferase/4-amino-4-deoxychorismate lyase